MNYFVCEGKVEEELFWSFFYFNNCLFLYVNKVLYSNFFLLIVWVDLVFFRLLMGMIFYCGLGNEFMFVKMVEEIEFKLIYYY